MFGSGLPPVTSYAQGLQPFVAYVHVRVVVDVVNVVAPLAAVLALVVVPSKHSLTLGKPPDMGRVQEPPFLPFAVSGVLGRT